MCLKETFLIAAFKLINYVFVWCVHLLCGVRMCMDLCGESRVGCLLQLLSTSVLERGALGESETHLFSKIRQLESSCLHFPMAGITGPH